MLARSLLVAFGGTTALYGGAALAQQAPQDTQPTAQELQRVTVTGSNIRRTDAETPSPVQVITAEDLKKSGYTSTQDVLQRITANGQGTLSQGFSGAFASGASGIALRGLNVGATLVLIDGHRMAPYPIGDDGQRSFVDISNIPFDSIERIEILKDGASAVYGSDAVAGVVNIILKRSFVGKTFTADLGTSGKNDGQTYHVAGTVGFGDLNADGHNFYISGELRRQNQIKFSDRGGMYTQTDFTGSGGYNLTPGVPNPLVGTHPRSGTGYITDPAGNNVGFFPGCDAASQTAGKCTYHDNWSQIQPPTENNNLVGRFTQKLGDDWQVSLQGSFFQSKSQQVGGPSRTFPSGYQGITSGPGVVPALLDALGPTSIPSTNPSFPTGTGLASGTLRYTFLDVGPTITETDARSSRVVADLQGHAGAWDINASAGFTQVLLDVTGKGYVNPYNLQTALNSTTDPYLVGGPNTASVMNFIAPELSSHDTSKLSFVHVGAGRDLMTLPGGPLAAAFGIDYMHRTQDARAPAGVEAGFYNGAYSNNYTVGKQDVASAYGELVAPIFKELEADAAIRYDHYNLSGGKASPKIGLKYTPIPELAFRATASKGFRAPGPAENGTAGQTFFAGASSDPILCGSPDHKPTDVGNFPSQCALNVGTVQGTNPALKPETSKSFTFGVIVEPVKDFSATLDFYQIEISNQIVAGGPTTAVRGTNFAPIDQVQPDGTTALVTPPVAPIAYFAVGYINANTTKTNGVDLGLQYHHRFEGVGDVKSEFMWSYMNKYDLTIDGTTYKLAGTHGPFFFSGDTGNPKSRIQWANTLTRGPWQITGTINYISGYSVTDPSAIAFTGESQDDCVNALAHAGGTASSAYSGVLDDGKGVVPNGVGCKVKSFTTFDLAGRYDVTKQLSIHASILNLFNKGAPEDWATYGGALGAVPWNPSLHTAGAIGRYFTLGATYTF
jgi:iron complex outermembrane receptor protein